MAIPFSMFISFYSLPVPRWAIIYFEHSLLHTYIIRINITLWAFSMCYAWCSLFGTYQHIQCIHQTMRQTLLLAPVHRLKEWRFKGHSNLSKLRKLVDTGIRSWIHTVWIEKSTFKSLCYVMLYVNILDHLVEQFFMNQ